MLNKGFSILFIVLLPLIAQSAKADNAQIPQKVGETEVLSGSATEIGICDALIAQNHYALARKRANDSFRETKALDILNYGIEIDQKSVSVLSELVTKDKITSLEDLRGDLDNIIKKDSWWTKTRETAKKPLAWAGGILSISGATTWNKLSADTRKSVQELFDGNPIQIVDIEEATFNIDRFNEVKNALQETSKLLSENLLNTTSPDFAKNASESKSKTDSLLKQLSAVRCNYISYTVISPYLGEAERYLFMAKTKSSLNFRHDKVSLEKCVSAMRLGGRDGIIMETKQDVRNQFVQLVKGIKQVAGEAEYKQLEVVQSLADKVGGKEPKGEERWLAY